MAEQAAHLIEVRGLRDLLCASAARIEHIRGRHLAMIFQDPSSALNPVRRVGKQVAEAVRLHRGMDAVAARAETIRLFDLVHRFGGTNHFAARFR